MGLWRKRRFFRGLTVAACIGVALCIGFQFDVLYGIQLRSADFLFRTPDLDQSTQPENTIVVVAIDDKSLNQMGRFSSWPRSYHAHLIDVLAEAKARVITFDILFSELAPDDEELAASVRAAGNVILPLTGTSIEQKLTMPDKTIEFEDFLRPLRVLEKSATALGHAVVIPDEDGVVRRLPLVIRSDEDYELALALVAAAEYRQYPQVFESPASGKLLPFGDQLIPVDDTNCMLINYSGSSAEVGMPASIQVVSYVDVLRDRIDPAIFQDSLVIVGATAIGLGDTFWTPMGQIMSGAEVHANAISTILTGNFLNVAPPPIIIALILLLALLCGTLVLYLRVPWAVLSAIFLCIIYLLAAFSLFDKGIMLNMVYPPLTILCTFVGVTLYCITFEQSEKRAITKVFGRYVQPQVVDKVLAALDEGELKLGGEQHEVTVAFADIRGFTSMSENIQPEELVKALNIYLSVVIKEVLKYDGMINKFGGDSVMAVWNVPTECEEHALSAVKATIGAQHAIKELQQKETALPRMDFGIGINTGRAVAGNMGSEDRLEYSVIGDTVNLASRLTSVTPGGKVWIGSSTFELIKDYITAKQLKPVKVKGKQQPVMVYEVIDYMPKVGNCDGKF